ncbi:hypothetical protein CSB45_07860 [candidate division KSB3 bacterium]|uniref:Glycosyltransferase RgtA/B/C/D-like domain-containing protein n=1 Tax=candidate division KSB3 bacterium TaxID=2044937 RepID=A0A2G6E5T4_9BACT|nr:MAG: hypothetical protein CSB45_07860 [candidate division KSB3 bacterium]PIE29944.1 MAG: hypothetical protein CSA57_06560 [candidate division KSB3 bacterium]
MKIQAQKIRQTGLTLFHAGRQPSAVQECLLYLLPCLLFFTLYRYISPSALSCAAAFGGLVTGLRLRATREKSIQELIVFFLFFSALSLFVLGFWNLYSIGTLRWYPDTGVYETYSNNPLSDIYFWISGGRPFLTALVFKIFQRDFTAINYCYIIIYLLAVFLLFAAVSRMLNSAHDRMLSVYMLMLLFLNQHTIAFWVTNAMSETLSIALTLLNIALFAYVASSPRNITTALWKGNLLLGGIVVSTILLIGARDTNMYFIPVLVLFYWRYLPQRGQRIFLVLGLLLIFITFNKGADLSGRWEFSLFNTLTRRIIPDEDLRRLFQQRYQLPSDDRIMSCQNVWASYSCPGKKTLETWIRHHGPEAYKHFLITHPLYAFQEWIKAWDEMQEELWTLDFKPSYYADPLIREKKLNPFVFNFPGNISLPLMLAIALTGVLFLAENPLILFCLLHALNQSFIAFHGDAMEVPRHCQQSAMTLKLAAVLCALQLFLDLKDTRKVPNAQ